MVQSLEKAAEYTPADPAFKPLLSKAADGVERHAWLDGWREGGGGSYIFSNSKLERNFSNYNVFLTDFF